MGFMYKVYVTVDEQERVTSINSSAFLSNLDGYVKIDEGYGDKFHHAQGNYLDKPLRDERGVMRYKLVNGKIVERSQNEMDADYVEPPIQPTQEDRLAVLEAQNEMLTECLLEMSSIVYG
ncbi:MAG: hypothetical protein IJE43_07980 [Alphaproteobacteria bacterium]|nr:hypothetical protein [Alphaproteobacteria bacterium]